MPPEFLANAFDGCDFWLPLSFDSQLSLRDSYHENNNAYWLMIMGRLNPMLSLSEAQANVNLALRQFLTDQAGSQLTADRQKGIKILFAHCPGRGVLRTAYTLLKAVADANGDRGYGFADCLRERQRLSFPRCVTKGGDSLCAWLWAPLARGIIRQLFTESMMLAALGGIFGHPFALGRKAPCKSYHSGFTDRYPTGYLCLAIPAGHRSLPAFCLVWCPLFDPAGLILRRR
jgi:hypothetical protein